jgi:hypothetical protein
MSAKPLPSKPKGPVLEIPKDLEPVYVNMVRIAHAPSEIVFEFAQYFPGSPKARVKARVVTSPLSAKLFHRALSENLAKYETTYGEIAVPGDKALTEYSKLFRPMDSSEGDEEQE